jgi:cysteinyl-tRNA synthetase
MLKFSKNFLNNLQYNQNKLIIRYINKNYLMEKWIHPVSKLDSNNIYRTGLRVNNSLTNQKEEFITKDGTRTVKWYSCGPTVYDSAHLGHARTYVSFDILRRIMASYFGYDVNIIMNITDIDDKIIMRSNELNKEFTAFARHWEDEFFKDMKSLNVLYPNHITRVSEYIPEIIKFIEKLIANKYAYVSNNSVYFDIEAFKANKV